MRVSVRERSIYTHSLRRPAEDWLSNERRSDHQSSLQLAKPIQDVCVA